MPGPRAAGLWVAALALGRAAAAWGQPAASGGEAPAADAPAADAPPAEGAAPDAADLAARLAELEARLAALEPTPAAPDAERQALLDAADAEIGATGPAAAVDPGQPFASGARALQALNPEISVVADVVATAYLDRDGYVVGGHAHEGETLAVERSGVGFRAFEAAFQSNLDPYSTTKLIFSLHHGEPELCEGYVSWVGLVPRTAVTVGRFHQQLGVINRWHEHGLDQIDRPLVHAKYLGHHGLVGTGVSIKTLLPRLWAHAQELTLEVANGENEELFAGEFFSLPTALLHLKSYWDLSPATYLELGATGLWGLNNRTGYVDDATGLVFDEPRRHTVLAAADLTISWLPVSQAKYRGVTSRSEVLYLRKEVDHEGDRETGDALGGFTYLDVRIGPRTLVGARLDVGQNFDLHDPSWLRKASPYLTFWQSEFVYLRLQYGATWESEADLAHQVLLQVDWSAGPHKHDKY